MVLKSLKDFPMVPQVITKEAQFTADSSIIMSYTLLTTHMKKKILKENC